MSEKKSFGEKLNDFFAGKGFYIVLSLCVAVIGISAYYLLSNRGTDVEDAQMANSAIDERVREAAPREAPVSIPPQTDNRPAEKDGPTSAPEDDGEAPVWNEQQADAAASAQFIWPLEGEITLPYSVTALVYHEKLGDWRTHDALNISAPLGTQVQAVSTGTVESVGYNDMGGMTVVIEHAGGIKSIYSNLASVPTVYEGDNVMTGEVIGSLGATAPGETAEAPTLSLKMTLDGHSVDPTDYLPPR